MSLTLSIANAPVKAADHDLRPEAKLVPLGILEVDSGQLFLRLGVSAETSDFIADGINAASGPRELALLLAKHSLEFGESRGQLFQAQLRQFLGRCRWHFQEIFEKSNLANLLAALLANLLAFRPSFRPSFRAGVVQAGLFIELRLQPSFVQFAGFRGSRDHFQYSQRLVEFGFRQQAT